MQTFLPYANFAATMAVLDQGRLGKQRVEALQILRALTFEGYGWAAHPAVAMWRGHVEALVAYGQACAAEWRRRGHADTCAAQIAEFAPGAGDQTALAQRGLLPPWLGDAALHRSHQSALVRKDPAHYRPLFPDVPDDLDYVWPAPAAAAPAVRGPFSAWVVRAADATLLGVFVGAGVVALVPADGAGPREHLAGDPPPRRRTKRARAVERFVCEMAPGDPVVTPLPSGDVLAGVVAGDYGWGPLPPLRRPHHLRPVAWERFVARAALHRPSALQDPQLVYAVYGEAVLAPRVRSG